MGPLEVLFSMPGDAGPALVTFFGLVADIDPMVDDDTAVFVFKPEAFAGRVMANGSDPGAGHKQTGHENCKESHENYSFGWGTVIVLAVPLR
jgi:hypothetical protein